MKRNISESSFTTGSELLSVTEQLEYHDGNDNSFTLETESRDNNNEEDDFLSDIEWEEVPLQVNCNQPISKDDDIISITIDSPDSLAPKKRKLDDESLRKRMQTNELKKLYFNFNIITMPFFINILRQRSIWLDDLRLNRRLKRSVPKLITKKFIALNTTNEPKFETTLKTLLIGLVLWFRANYKINSNGFRQHPYRLLALDTLKNNKKKNAIKQFNNLLHQEDKYYGSRPKLDNENLLDNVRQLSREKTSNRDNLAIFFLIILQNLLDSKDFKLSLCFALPLLNYEIDYNVKLSSLFQVPNKFDTDYLHPYFWIELEPSSRLSDKIYIIDPISHINENELVICCNRNEPIKCFQPPSISSQNFTYVVVMDPQTKLIKDISPRYIKNLSYRYFDLRLHRNIKLYSAQFKLFIWFNRCLTKYNKNMNVAQDELTKNTNLLIELSQKNITLPKTIKELQKSNNFVVPSLLKKNEYINPNSTPLCLWNYNNESEPLFWKSQILLLKSRQHWKILGRDVIPNCQPIKTKKYKPLSKPHGKKSQWQINSQYEIKELYSWDQTTETPPLPTTYVDANGLKCKIEDVNFYRNNFGHVEIYLEKLKPDGFAIINTSNNDNKSMINEYNRKNKDKIRYLDIVSGFDFKQKPGYVVPIINSILLHDRDYARATSLFESEKERKGLKQWHTLIRRMGIKDRLDTIYEDSNKE